MDTPNLLKIIENALNELILKSSITVNEEILEKLEDLRKEEENNSIISSQLQLMIENIHYAKKKKIPVCQDTGHINFFIQLGNEFPIISNFKDIISNSLKKLTKESIIRPNTVDPITQINEGNNLGLNSPPIYLDISKDSSDLIITTMNKGGGSENMSALFMLSPANGPEQLSEKIIERMKYAGGKPCTPTILGIGIGGDASKSMYLAKKALLRPQGSRNKRKDVSKLENSILKKINQLNIGIMGLGGHSNCLDVRIELAMRHPATYPVGLIVECYCHRTESVKISSKGTVKFGKLDDNFKFIELSGSKR